LSCSKEALHPKTKQVLKTCFVLPCIHKKAGERMAGSGKLLPICIICEQVPQDGIVGGVVVNGNFICAKCEDELLSITTDDVKYRLFQEKLKKIWL
jgi:hypothetical protein